MSKTIISKRNKLTSTEIKVYKSNLRLMKLLRKCFLIHNSNFGYIRVFTEAQAGGKCRTKFWGVSKKDKHILLKYLNNWYPFNFIKGYGCKIHEITWKTDKENSVIIYIQ